MRRVEQMFKLLVQTSHSSCKTIFYRKLLRISCFFDTKSSVQNIHLFYRSLLKDNKAFFSKRTQLIQELKILFIFLNLIHKVKVPNKTKFIPKKKKSLFQHLKHKNKCYHQQLLAITNYLFYLVNCSIITICNF